MKDAITDAGIDSKSIDYINAHGTSTPANDLNETLAIKSLLGNDAYNVRISSTKSMTGHLLGGGCAFEAMATILAIKNGKIVMHHLGELNQEIWEQKFEPHL